MANYNKTRINISHLHDSWMELKEALRFKLMLKCQHQCHCTCNSEIGICIINDAGRQAVHKKQCFSSNVAKQHFKLPKKITKMNDIIPLSNSFHKGNIVFFICLKQVQ